MPLTDAQKAQAAAALHDAEEMAVKAEAEMEKQAAVMKAEMKKKLHEEAMYLTNTGHAALVTFFCTLDFTFGAAMVLGAGFALSDNASAATTSVSMYLTIIFWGVMMMLLPLLTKSHEEMLRTNVAFLFAPYGKPAFLFLMAGESMGLMTPKDEQAASFNLMHWWVITCTIVLGFVNGLMQLFASVHNEDYRRYLVRPQDDTDVEEGHKPMLFMESSDAEIVRHSLTAMAGPVTANTVRQLCRRFSTIDIEFTRKDNGVGMLTKSIKLFTGEDGRVSNINEGEPSWDSSSTFTYRPSDFNLKNA